MTNILITSAGRRGYIVDYFKEALNGKGVVHVGNSTEISAAFSHADVSVVTPIIYDDSYIPFVLDYCVKNEIKMVISLFDIDLYILAKNKRLFEDKGIKVIVSSPETIEICNDKWKTYEFCRRNGISVPRTVIADNSAIEKSVQDLQFPLIVKPRWGMGSLGIFEVSDPEELTVCTRICIRKIENSYMRYESEQDITHSVIAQEKIIGDEYGIDIINDLDGNYVTHVVKKKVAMRAGETDCATVVDDKSFDEFARNLSGLIRHIGNLDVDVFRDRNDIKLLEMNARFGGGYPFTHCAGVDIPGALIKWTNNEKADNELVVKNGYGKTFHKDICMVEIIGENRI